MCDAAKERKSNIGGTEGGEGKDCKVGRVSQQVMKEAEN